jgi:G3E family GTPase
MVMQDEALHDHDHEQRGHVCDDSCDHDHEDDEHDALLNHEHDPSVQSVALRFDRPFDKARLDAWLAAWRDATARTCSASKASWPLPVTTAATCCRACTA